METGYIIQIIALSSSVFSAGIGSLLCFLYNREAGDRVQRKLSRTMGWAFLLGALCWVGPLFYVLNPALFIGFNYVLFPVLMYNLVLLYYFICTLTTTGNRERFSPIHYLLPIVISIIAAVCSALVPYDVRYELVRTGDLFSSNSVLSYVFSSSTLVFCVYNITYSLLALRRANRYRRAVEDYSSDSEKNSIAWVYLFIILIIINIPFPFASTLMNRNAVLTSPIIIIGAALALLQHVTIMFNLLSENYVVIVPKEEDEQEIEPEEEQEKEFSNGETSVVSRRAEIFRERFERYMQEKKPFLNPDLKITDLCAGLSTNRTYISAYINKEYGMNFSRYINHLRLNEASRLRMENSGGDIDPVEIVRLAGFSSYRSYKRAREVW